MGFASLYPSCSAAVRAATASTHCSHERGGESNAPCRACARPEETNLPAGWEASGGQQSQSRGKGAELVVLLLLSNFVPALWVPLYNSADPSFAGMPFFYWFQPALVFVSAAVTAVVYWATE